MISEINSKNITIKKLWIWIYEGRLKSFNLHLPRRIRKNKTVFHYRSLLTSMYLVKRCSQSLHSHHGRKWHPDPTKTPPQHQLRPHCFQNSDHGGGNWVYETRRHMELSLINKGDGQHFKMTAALIYCNPKQWEWLHDPGTKSMPALRFPLCFDFTISSSCLNYDA